MTRNVHTVTEETSLPELAALLESRAIKRVPVMRRGKVVGIVSRANLLQGLAAARPHVERSLEDAELRRALTGAVAETGIRTTYLNIVVSDGVAHLWGAVESREEIDALKVVVENAEDLKGVENHVNVLPTRVMRSMGSV
jgi:CBS-domain-containing membrane protein